MGKKRAKIFVSHHPSDLLLYKNLIILTKKLMPEAPIILFKVNHRYYKTFDFSPYKSYFDIVEEFPFITYQKNLWQGMREMRQFKERLAQAKTLLEQFDHVDVLIQNSAWLPVNMLLFFFAKANAVKHIFRWDFGMEEHKKTKRGRWRTFYCRLYQTLFGNSYKVHAVSTLKGKFVDFAFSQPVPGQKLTIVSPAGSIKHLAKEELSFPLLTHRTPEKKDMVVIFGDADILDWKEYVDNRKEAEKKLIAFFERLNVVYRNYSIYYKPHPADEKLMPGIKKGVYHAFTNGVNTQSILDTYHSRIKAVYTVFSTSAMWSSFFGIPSYVAYRVVYNRVGALRFDHVFTQKSMSSPLIALVRDKEEIGTRDNIKIPIHYVDTQHISEAYRRILTL